MLNILKRIPRFIAMVEHATTWYDHNDSYWPWHDYRIYNYHAMVPNVIVIN